MARKIPTWHILQSLRHERILHGVSQDIFIPETSEPKGRTASPQFSNVEFRHTGSNDSVLRSNSYSEFPFDVKSSPCTGRRGTIPCYGCPETRKSFRRNSVNPSVSPLLSPAWLATSPPVWQRTASLNALPGKNYSKLVQIEPHKVQTATISDYTDNHKGTCLNTLAFERTGSSSLCNEVVVAHTTQPLSSECFPIMLEPAIPIHESDSNTDDEEYLPTISPVNSVFSPPFDETVGPTLRHHRRHKSQPTNTYVINTVTPDSTTPTRQSECDDSAYYGIQMVSGNSLSEHEEVTIPNKDTSLMNEIINELSKSNSEASRKFQDFSESQDSQDIPENSFQQQRQRSMSLHSHIGSLEKRFHTRRKAIQLDNIFESTDEENDTKYGKTSDSTYFVRNTKLRRSKSSFELSFHRRLKPPSPLITHMKRSREKISDRPFLHPQTSSPILTLANRKSSVPSSEEGSTEETSHKLVNERIKKTSAGDIERKTSLEKKKHSFKTFFKKGKSISPTHGKWGFKGLRRAMAVSMETGLDHTGITEADVMEQPSPPHRHGNKPPSSRLRKHSSKVMLVVASGNKVV